MKNVITAFLALAVIAVGLFIARDHQLTDGIKAAHQAELNGDYKTALSNYVNTLEKAVPSLVAPRHQPVKGPAGRCMEKRDGGVCCVARRTNAEMVRPGEKKAFA